MTHDAYNNTLEFNGRDLEVRNMILNCTPLLDRIPWREKKPTLDKLNNQASTSLTTFLGEIHNMKPKRKRIPPKNKQPQPTRCGSVGNSIRMGTYQIWLTRKKLRDRRFSHRPQKVRRNTKQGEWEEWCKYWILAMPNFELGRYYFSPTKRPGSARKGKCEFLRFGVCAIWASVPVTWSCLRGIWYCENTMADRRHRISVGLGNRRDCR